MRNRIAHQETGVGDEIVWDTLRTHLPDLLERLGVASRFAVTPSARTSDTSASEVTPSRHTMR